MLKYIWLTLFSSLSCFPLSGQTYDALVSQTTNQIQLTPGDDTSWKDQDRWTYSYNNRRQYVYARYDLWDDDLQKWLETGLYNYGYDQSGNRIMEHTYRYNDEGEAIRDRIIRRKYKGKLLISTEIYNVDLKKAIKETSMINYSYDSQDRRIKRVEEYRDNYSTHWIETSSSYFNNYGCQTAEATDRVTFFLDSYYEIRDSTAADYEGDCMIKEARYYTSNNPEGPYNLYYRYRIDREYDENNNLLKESLYESPSENYEWQLSTMYTYESDASGRPVTTTYLNNSSGYRSIDFKDYNHSGNVIYELKKVWNEDLADWVNSYVYRADYQNDTLLTYYIYHFNWDTVSGDYAHYVSTSYEFDENNILIRKLESQKNTNAYNQEFYTQTVESTYVNRCDGNTVSTRVEEIESTNTYQIEYPTRTVNEYYENAPCEPAGTELADLRLFPNPSRGYINILNQMTYGNAEVSVLNYNGQVVFSENRYLNNYFSLDLYDLPPGVYILRIRNEFVLSSRKFILTD